MKKVAFAFFLLLFFAALLVGVYWFFHRRPSPTPADGPAAALAVVRLASALQLTAELPWAELYVGDPLRVRVRLSSPRAQQEAHRRARQVEEGQPVPLPSFAPPPIPAAAWPAKLTFQLYRLQPDGSRQSVPGEVSWLDFLRPEKEIGPARKLDVVALSREWMCPPERTASLGAGPFVLRVAWSGKGLVQDSLLEAEGELKAADLAFEIRPLSDSRQRAAQADRLAYFEFARGHFREARAKGEEALRLDPEGFSPERAQTYLLVGDSALALGDLRTARATYQALLKRLPPPERDDLAFAVSRQLDALSKGGKTR